MCTIIPLEDLKDVKYGQVICYPRYDAAEAERRIIEMGGLGIKALCFAGGKSIANLQVLGKGCTSIVVLAVLNNGSRAALKISRVDSDIGRIRHEAEMLQIANSVGVGPKLLGYTDRLLLMEYIDGRLIADWVKGLSSGDAIPRLRRVLRDILEQCWRLDSIGLDHGELSRADKHIIIDDGDGAHIVDFETASNRRRPSNVTSISQYLFIRSPIAKTISELIKAVKVEKILQALKRYKKERSRENFESILSTLDL